MDIEATKLEIESVTDFQKSLHFPIHPDQPFTSKFYREYLKTTWYCSSSMALKSAEEGDEVLYTLNPTFHYLMYTYMAFTLPPIKVKESHNKKIRIGWCHNIGTNIIEKASFKEDELTYQTFDNIWLDDYFQFYMAPGAGKRRNHKIGVGSVPFLEDWDDALPTYPIDVEQPWFYGEETAVAYPIFLRNSQVRAEHRYTYRRKISDLLRMQIYNKNIDTWTSVHPAQYMKYLQIGRSITIQKPLLWAKYSYITNEELNTLKCKKELTFYIKDVEICDAQNPNRFDTTADIPLICTNPCLAMFWKAENMDASGLNNYSNYTCNTDDLYSGWDVIGTTTLKYGTKYKLRNMESHHFNIAESRKHFLSSPNETGYHGYSFAWNSSNYDGEVGVVLSKLNAKLICKISNNDIRNMVYREDANMNNNVENESFDYLLDDHEPIEPLKIKDSPNFITRVRLLVLKKLTMTKNPSGDYTFALC